MNKKKMLLKAISLLCVIVLAVGSMSSCMLLMSDGNEDYMTEEEVRDMISGSLGTTTTVENVNEYDITIENNGSANLLAASKAVLSAVSVSCNFNVSYQNIFGQNVLGEESSAGAGVIYKLDKTKGDAYIITNYHVVYNASATENNGISKSIKVYLYGLESAKYAISAEYIGGSLTQDLAVLKVTGSQTLLKSNAVAATFTNSDDVSILDTAIAIGNPAAGGISATVGCVNVDSEEVVILGSDGRTEIAFRLMRIDTAVNSGNSGGGLFNDKGELIGIVNAKITSSSIDNIAYAIPSNIVKGVADNIIHYCDGTDKVNPYRYVIGITMDNSELYTVYDEETGKIHKREVVKIATINAGSIAEGNFKVGDILKSVSIDGAVYEINRMFQIKDSMFLIYSESEVVFTVERDGADVTVPVSFAGAEPSKVN
ncbi:MAG: trypsin-like peptidase domain-containing protein [Clostridia bacterium]|nr:trypsin-like peptidase domain-containing protein [Clostridia bacterium]